MRNNSASHRGCVLLVFFLPRVRHLLFLTRMWNRSSSRLKFPSGYRHDFTMRSRPQRVRFA